MVIGLAVHIVSAIIWIGSLFFMFVVLKPTTLPFELEQRLAIWRHDFKRFLPWSWISIGALLLSGFAMVFLGFGGLPAIPAHVRAMMATGFLAVAIYAYLLVLPWRHFLRAMSHCEWLAAEQKIVQVRRFIGATLAIGLATAIIGATGRYYG